MSNDHQKRGFVPALQWPGPLNPDAKRVEIDEFIVDNAMNNIFLLALREMMDEKIRKADDEDWFSFYNLGSIHGYPTELWQNVPNKAAKDPKNSGFYCTHGSRVFPTWHRCEIAMFEQAVYKKMEVVANRFSEQNGRSYFLDALNRFRLPYWDPVMPRNPENGDLRNMFGMPKIFLRPEVYVLDPQKGETAIDNPLYRFSFPTKEEYDKTGRTTIPWGDLEKNPNILMPAQSSKWTLRAPDQNGESNDDKLDENIRASARTLSTSLWLLLNPGPKDAESGDEGWSNRTRQWDVFANHSISKYTENTWPTEVSLESWHDQIHGLVGSGNGASGHMGVVAVASFDPVFFFHHNNIERLLALYQALYDHGKGKDSKFVPKRTQGSKDGILYSDSELSPFEPKEGKALTSDDVRDWTKDCYAMPGVKDLDDAGREAVAQYVRETYFWVTEKSRPPKSLTYPRNLSTVYALVGKGKKFVFQPSEPVQFVELKDNSVVTNAIPQDLSTPSVEEVNLKIKDETQNPDVYPPGSFIDPDNSRMLTWNALINVRKYGLGGSFIIQLLIGKDDIPAASDASDDFRAPNQVGFSAIFAATDSTDCENCARNQDMIYEDIVPLTTELPKYLRRSTASPDQWPRPELRTLENLEPDQVVPFLQKHLVWRVVSISGDVYSDADVQAAGLKLAVADRFFDLPTQQNPLGDYSPHRVHPEITAGKVGGFNG